MVRVIGGEARGRRLVLPAGCAIRPTSDFVREALFNILGPQDGNAWLDICAGTGAVGIEALSRGAEKAVFVESSRACCEAIRANLAKCGFDRKARVIEKPAGPALQILGGLRESFHVIFADPPYNKDLIGTTFEDIEVSGVAAEGSIIVLQRSIKEKIERKSSVWQVADERIYGDTAITILASVRG